MSPGELRSHVDVKCTTYCRAVSTSERYAFLCRVDVIMLRVPMLCRRHNVTRSCAVSMCSRHGLLSNVDVKT